MTEVDTANACVPDRLPWYLVLLASTPSSNLWAQGGFDDRKDSYVIMLYYY